MTDLNWELLLGATVIDRRIWERIPADLHAPLLEVMTEAGKKLRGEIRKADESAVEAMKKRGLNVVSVDAQAREAWIKVAESVYPRIRGRIVPASAFDEAVKYRDEYRQRLKK
jgi:TRAP-type C4-dicarboxylate transport system substrate-binding protein